MQTPRNTEDIVTDIFNALLKAIIAFVLIGYPLLVVADFRSGLPGNFDPKTVEYGKGPKLGDDYRCHNFRQSYDTPCTKQEYFEQQKFLLWGHLIFLPFTLFFAPYLAIIVFVFLVFLTAIFYKYDLYRRRAA